MIERRKGSQAKKVANCFTRKLKAAGVDAVESERRLRVRAAFFSFSLLDVDKVRSLFCFLFVCQRKGEAESNAEAAASKGADGMPVLNPPPRAFLSYELEF